MQITKYVNFLQSITIIYGIYFTLVGAAREDYNINIGNALGSKSRTGITRVLFVITLIFIRSAASSSANVFHEINDKLVLGETMLYTV